MGLRPKQFDSDDYQSSIFERVNLIVRVAIILTICCFATYGFADHWNTRNLLNACDDDNAFASSCYTYLGAYKDLLGYMIFSSDEERAALLCILDVPTADIAQTLSEMTLRSTDPQRIGDFLIKEFCS